MDTYNKLKMDIPKKSETKQNNLGFSALPQRKIETS